MTIQGTRVVGITGLADLAHKVWDVEMQAHDPGSGHTYVTLIRVIDRHMYMQMPEWKPLWHGCWLEFRAGDFPPGAQVAGVTSYPGEVLMLQLLSAIRFGDEDHLLGTAPYDVVQSLAPARVRMMLGLEGADKLHVPVTIALEDGRIASVHLEGVQVINVLQANGVAVPDDLRELLYSTVWDVRYPRDYTPHAIRQPKHELVMSSDTGPDEGCH